MDLFLGNCESGICADYSLDRDFIIYNMTVADRKVTKLSSLTEYTLRGVLPRSFILRMYKLCARMLNLSGECRRISTCSIDCNLVLRVIYSAYETS